MRRTSYQHRGDYGFTEQTVGMKGDVSGQGGGVGGKRHNLAVLFLQLVILRREVEGLRHTEEGVRVRPSFLHSTFIQWIAAQPSMAALRGRAEASDPMEEACGLSLPLLSAKAEDI